jgi:hypothetical protein
LKNQTKQQKKINEVKPLEKTRIGSEVFFECNVCLEQMPLPKIMCDDCLKALHELILEKRDNKR